MRFEGHLWLVVEDGGQIPGATWPVIHDPHEVGLDAGLHHQSHHLMPDVPQAGAVEGQAMLGERGAGDSFDAGYISAMEEGLDGRLCLQRPVECGSLSTRSLGRTAAQPTRGELTD